MKKLIFLLQAFAMLLLCAGIAWIVFVLNSVNPTPPTAMDLQARNTQDLSFANLNSTAVALAREMLADAVPSPSGGIFLPITGRETATPGPMAAVTLRAVFAGTITPTPFSLLSNLFPSTATREKEDKPASTATYIPAPTNTISPPTPTATYVPSQTQLPPPTFVTLVRTPTVIPTGTPTEVITIPTITSAPATSTSIPTEPPTSPPATTEPPTAAATAPIVDTTQPPTQSTP